MAVRNSKKKSYADVLFGGRDGESMSSVRKRMTQYRNIENNTMMAYSPTKRGRKTRDNNSDSAKADQLFHRYSAPYRKDFVSSPQNRVWKNNIGLRFGQAGGNGNGHVNYITGLATEEQDRKAMGQATH